MFFDEVQSATHALEASFVKTNDAVILEKQVNHNDFKVYNTFKF